MSANSLIINRIPPPRNVKIVSIFLKFNYLINVLEIKILVWGRKRSNFSF